MRLFLMFLTHNHDRVGFRTKQFPVVGSDDSPLSNFLTSCVPFIITEAIYRKPPTISPATAEITLKGVTLCKPGIA